MVTPADECCTQSVKSGLLCLSPGLRKIRFGDFTRPQRCEIIAPETMRILRLAMV